MLHAGDRSAEALSEHAAHPLIAGLAVKPLVPILRNVDPNACRDGFAGDNREFADENGVTRLRTSQ